MSHTYAISVRASGSALVVVDHSTRPPTPVRIVKLPNDLARVADIVREMVAENRTPIIDLDGRGEALRRVLGPVNVRWYRKTGRDRRALVDALDGTASMPGFHFPPELGHRDELRRALEGLRKHVDEDGAPEGELVVALAIALATYTGEARVW